MNLWFRLNGENWECGIIDCGGGGKGDGSGGQSNWEAERNDIHDGGENCIHDGRENGIHAGRGIGLWKWPGNEQIYGRFALWEAKCPENAVYPGRFTA